MAEFKKIGIVGIGQMGAGIAVANIVNGYHVIVCGRKEKVAFIKRIEAILAKMLEKGSIDVTLKDKALFRLDYVNELIGLKDCDLIIEAIPEIEDLKNDLFVQLDSICKTDAVFASNTSSLSIEKFQASISRQDRMIGIHFMNPAHILDLVEVVKTAKSSGDILRDVKNYLVSLKKQPVECFDSPGFIVNRTLFPMLKEALELFESGAVAPADIDRTMELAAGHPIGPLKLCDMIGLDICLRIFTNLESQLQNPRYAAPSVLRQLVDQGCLGRKSGKGIYSYNGEKK